MTTIPFPPYFARISAQVTRLRDGKITQEQFDQVRWEIEQEYKAACKELIRDETAKSNQHDFSYPE